MGRTCIVGVWKHGAGRISGLKWKTWNNVSMKKILYLRYSQFLLSTTYYQGDQIKQDEGIGNVGCMGSMCI